VLDETTTGSDDALDYFLAEGWITRVLHVVKSGKEATVFCCEAAPSTGAALLAAKIYRPREGRGFQDDSLYRVGRWVGGSRLQRALANKSRKGREYQFGSWVDQEWDVLTRMHAIGSDVPTPVSRCGDAILMEYLGDADEPAPRLHAVRLPPAEADYLLRVLLRNVELWLAHDVVHGDLSAYNVLYWDGRVRVIDFPQAVDPRANPNARDLLARDVANVCGYFARQGVPSDPTRIAADLWGRFLRAEL
jgi:RIO kinase 1